MKISIQIEPSLKPNSPNLLASATVTLETENGPIVIRDCRLLKNRRGAVWFSLPSFRVQASGRQVEYRQTIELPRAIQQQISTEALRLYKDRKLEESLR
jgi:hypothetical protein